MKFNFRVQTVHAINLFFPFINGYFLYSFITLVRVIFEWKLFSDILNKVLQMLHFHSVASCPAVYFQRFSPIKAKFRSNGLRRNYYFTKFTIRSIKLIQKFISSAFTETYEPLKPLLVPSKAKNNMDRIRVPPHLVRTP